MYFIPRAFWGPTDTKQFLNILPVPLHRKPQREREMKEPNEDFLLAASLCLTRGRRQTLPVDSGT